MKKTKNRFYEFKNETDESYGLYIYGSITDDKNTDWGASETDVDLTDFKTALNGLKSNTTLNMYVNSPGGSVFASSTMASMLERAKETKNLKINTYVDGLCASACSFLIMVSDVIYLYANSMLMVHKPMSFAWGNADDMQKEIDTLNSIEENVMMPLYMKKAKVDEDTIKNLIDAESWLSSKEVDNFFDVELLSTTKEVSACVDSELFRHYKNVPEELKEEEEMKEETEVVIEEEEETTESEEQVEEEMVVPEESTTEEESSEDVEQEETGEEETEETEEEEPKQPNVASQNIDYSYFENRLKGGV